MKGSYMELEGIFDEAKARRIVLTKDEFAKIIGSSRASLYRYKNGDEIPASVLEAARNLLLDNTLNVLPETSAYDSGETYIKKRFMQKISNGPIMVPLVSVKAQAGYSRSYQNSDFLNSLEYFPILPGIDPHGAIWRFFEVDGDSMMDFLKSGDYVLANQVIKEDWSEVRNFHVYVVVTDSIVTIKRIYKRNDFKELVLIPDNEAYSQKVIKTENIIEMWRYRRHIGWDASPGRKIEIKV